MTSRLVIAFSAVILAAACAASLSQTVITSCYIPDKPFPQYMDLWQEGWSFKDEDGETLRYARPDMPLGGYVFIYIRNATDRPVKISDLTLQGVRLSAALAMGEKPTSPEDSYHSSILFSKLPASDIETLKAAGWPVWWKPEPDTVPAGGCGEIVIRLKRSPKPAMLNIGLVTGSRTVQTRVDTRARVPQFGTISFSTDLSTVYLYSRHPRTGARPVKVLLDERDVTSSASIVTDPALRMSAIVLKLPRAHAPMSYHTYRLVYSDGLQAAAGIRSWGPEMVYGMWSSPSDGDDPESATKSFISDYVKHGINCVMPYVVGKCRDYFHSDEGWNYCESMGVGRMIHWPAKGHEATFMFVRDEPDAHDAAARLLPEKDRLGAHGQYLVYWSRVLLENAPTSPRLLNIDNTYKPENWYMYHQLADIPCVDPYYPEQLDLVYIKNPANLAAHTRPTYIRAVCEISQSSGQPKPLHAILCSTQYVVPAHTGRFPTPEEKRMEVYYAIGAGAKGISYWWFAYDDICRGLSAGTPEAKALWNEIGLLGAEVRTAGPVITTSCPAELPTTASRYLTVRSLLRGTDTAAVATVNTNSASDRVGTVVRPVENSRVQVSLPAWLKPRDAFEVTADGIRSVTWEFADGKVSLDLGTVDVSRFVLVTADPSLKGQLEQRYNEMFAANVKQLRAERPAAQRQAH